MRKKSKKKQIVAMTLALSVLSSSVGMCGASAAEALSDTDDSGLQVTVVPLADSNADTDTSSDDKPTIERPEQSDTVETLPGTAEDNKDHIKGEDKDDTEDKGETGEETPGTGDTDTGDTEEKGETGEETPDTGDTDTGDTEEKGEEGSGSEGTPEEKPEETPKEDDTDYSCAYDPDTGHFKITFNIKADAEGDQTIELSKVQEVVSKNGESYLDTDKGKQELAVAQMWGDETMKYTYNGVTYIYTLATGTVSLYQEPGCTTIFDISLSNGSKHTYVYKDNSLTVATPDVSNTDKTGVTGFDGQELPKEYAGNTNLELKYSKTAASGCMEDLVDAALKEYGGNHDQNQFLDSEGNLTTQSTKTNVPAGTEVELINDKYYVKSGDHYYGGFSKSEVQTTKDGKTVLINDKNTYTLAYKKTKNGKNVEKDYYNGPFTHSSSALMNQDIRDALEQYMPAKGYKTYDDYILDYYKKADGSKYDSVSDLLKNDPKALKELSRSGSSMPNDPNTGNNTVKMDPSTLYDNFYKNVLSFKVGNQDTVDSEAGGNVDHNHSHGQWAADGTQETIGDYMAGKLNETPGAWAKANSYFNTLLASGLTADEATWAAFAMATNIDFQNAGNDYQNTAWNWYASMVLKQADGTLDLTKTDKDSGEIIGDEEGEGQTSFYLWKYETDKETGEKDTMYCTYVEPTYTTNKDGEQVLEKDGFYCWVKYDPTKDKLTYTVTTTNGKLNIDYALLENVVYYLQEAIAPDGYDIDPEIYVICDEESYKELEGTEVTNPATGATSKVTESSWLGSILGGKTLSFNFVNTATVVPDPDPEPTPDPDPVPPVDPDIPVDPANPDTPPVQDADPDETPVTPENPQNPAVQDAALPQTGTTSWMAGVLASLGSLLLACGWFFTRKQYSPKH
ncbi:MAG: LPXTG cell wall anchor domain-containing protein [Faecalibacterium sp.]|nr:LPXTG cell wall anchor domain-containing protein [Faecalibacterium sp.]